MVTRSWPAEEQERTSTEGVFHCGDVMHGCYNIPLPTQDLRAAIIGCGSIGRKRATMLSHCRLVACCDIDHSRAASLAAQVPQCHATTDWEAAVRCRDVDVVIVATTHDMLRPIPPNARGAAQHG